MQRPTAILVLWVLALLVSPDARAFCGFYVARADADLFNRSSRVVIARDAERTVLTMANDYEGDPAEFAIVVPVPTEIRREQIHVAEPALLDHLDAYTAPRLVEYYDGDPCAVMRLEQDALASRGAAEAPAAARRARALGVTIEASYTVGEYDILILSAKQGRGLVRWLRESGYRLPEGAEPVVSSYLRQGMRFFVARVNLDEQARLGHAFLRPLQIATETDRFMLPIRLGTLNADGAQDLVLYTLTRHGRVETANYRTVKVPTGAEVPRFVKADFADFYRDLFAEQVRREAGRAVFLEYAWDMGTCDPCAADPLSPQELRELGVSWLGEGERRGSPPVFVTRLHVRYDADHFPEDLVLHETRDRSPFQGRYVVRHPWSGEARCAAADRYRRELVRRETREARTLASLTGWDLALVLQRMGREAGSATPVRPWWERLWER